MSVASFELELSREYVLEKVIFIIYYKNSYASLQYHIFVWAQSIDSYISCKKC